jgi:hypothetical protein
MTLMYESSSDINLEAYQEALADKRSKTNETALDYLKDRYLRLNDKWRNEFLRTLWAFRDEIDNETLSWKVFNYLSDEFDINPNSIKTLDIDRLFEWVQN